MRPTELGGPPPQGESPRECLPNPQGPVGSPSPGMWHGPVGQSGPGGSAGSAERHVEGRRAPTLRSLPLAVAEAGRLGGGMARDVPDRAEVHSAIQEAAHEGPPKSPTPRLEADDFSEWGRSRGTASNGTSNNRVLSHGLKTRLWQTPPPRPRAGRFSRRLGNVLTAQAPPGPPASRCACPCRNRLTPRGSPH